MKIQSIVKSIVLMYLLASPSYAFLGATLEECEAEYGKVQHTQSKDGQTIQGFLVPLGVLKDTLVFATFNKSGKVEEIKYKGRSKEKFTDLQFILILGCNTPDAKKPFIETGLTPDKSKRMWARADYSAYIVSEEKIADVTLITQDAAVKFFSKHEKK